MFLSAAAVILAGGETVSLAEKGGCPYVVVKNILGSGGL